MLAVSAEFLQSIKDKSPQDVRLEFSGGDVIGASDIAITAGGLTYTEILNGETDVTFGRAVMSELSAVLVNADGRFTDFDFSREFTAKIGVKVGETFEYVNLGVFRGERPEKLRGKLIDFTAHDRMSLFDKSAESFADGLTFPCTLGEIYTKLCDFCGVGYVSATFANSGKTFDANPLADTDYTCREILGYIAEAAGSYARMSRDGAVELVWFVTADYTVTRTDRFEMTESEFQTPPIGKLEVYNSYGDQLNSSGTGDIVYGISDNPFLYIENDTQLAGLQPYVDVIYNRITSLPAYHPSSFRAEFNPVVQCGDIISVVDDYNETISFPVFVQTITWNGFGKVTYENTGGVIRQNAPFTQRELEQIKKKSLRATDLYTAIDSYLSTEEGIASITTAVGGKFVTSDELNNYAKTTEVSTKITQEVKNGIASLTLTASEETVTENVPTDEVVGEYPSYILEFANGYPFEFSEGWYVSGNAEVDVSYSWGKIEFNFAEETVVALECVNYGETTFDYGMISELDTTLEESITEDTSGIFHSFKGEHSLDTVTFLLTVPAGDHFICVKYIKDSSRSNSPDHFKIRAVATKTQTTSSKSTITLKSGSTEISSADITFKGFVTFESLSTPGATVIDGANIKTDNLYVKQVYLNDGSNSQPILHSELEDNGSGEVFLGFREYMANSANPHILKVYAKDIYFMQPGDNEDSKNTLRFSMTSRSIIGNASWTFDELSV